MFFYITYNPYESFEKTTVIETETISESIAANKWSKAEIESEEYEWKQSYINAFSS